MNAVANINNTKVEVINFESVPVLTTEQIAKFYGTEPNNIKVNFSRNPDRFVEGKHYFKLEGAELKTFKNMVTQSNYVPKRTARLILWTERGASRHAKMLETDQAWDVFEKLEECYFHRQEVLAKTHKSERTALNDAVNMLVAKTKHLNYSEAYKLVHQRFNVEHIEEIPFDTIPVVVEYVHHLIAMYSSSENKSSEMPSKHLDLIKNLIDAVLSQNFMTSKMYQALHVLDNEKGRDLADQAFQTNIAVLKLTRAMDMRDSSGRKIISDDLRNVNFSNGEHSGVRWFHPLIEHHRLMGALRISGEW